MNRPLLTSQDVVFVVEMRVPDAWILGTGNTAVETTGQYCVPDALVMLLARAYLRLLAHSVWLQPPVTQVIFSKWSTHMAKWFNCQLPWQGSIWLGCPTDKKVGLGNLTWLNLKKTVNKSFRIGTILMACVILSSRLHNKDFEHQNSSQTICNLGVPVAQLEICSGVIKIWVRSSFSF